jgi:hypothetical protein
MIQHEYDDDDDDDEEFVIVVYLIIIIIIIVIGSFEFCFIKHDYENECDKYLLKLLLIYFYY